MKRPAQTTLARLPLFPRPILAALLLSLAWISALVWVPHAAPNWRGGVRAVAEAETAAAAPSRCISVMYVDQDARVLLLGEGVTLTIQMTALCAGLRRHVETIFIVDRSGAVPWPRQTDPATVLAQALPLGGDDSWPMGAVFHGRGRVLGLCPLGLSGEEWLGCLSGAQRGGEPDWGGALDGARQMLESALDPELITLGLQDVRFILLAGGPLGEAACESARQALERVKQLGPQVHTACTRPGCERGCLSSLAWSDAAARGFVDVPAVFDLMSLPRHYGAVNVRQTALGVAFEIPETIRVDAISSTESVHIAREHRSVRATFDDPPRSGVTLTLRLSPRQPGYHRLVDGVVTVTVEDSLGGRYVGPSNKDHWRTPGVLVLEPRELPADFGSKRLYLPLLTRP